MDKKFSIRSMSEDSLEKSATTRKVEELDEKSMEIHQKLASLKFTTKKRMRDSERKLGRESEESLFRKKTDQEVCNCHI